MLTEPLSCDNSKVGHLAKICDYLYSDKRSWSKPLNWVKKSIWYPLHLLFEIILVGNAIIKTFLLRGRELAPIVCQK